jgi:hypothetical protein
LEITGCNVLVAQAASQHRTMNWIIVNEMQIFNNNRGLLIPMFKNQ